MTVSTALYIAIITVLGLGIGFLTQRRIHFIRERKVSRAENLDIETFAPLDYENLSRKDRRKLRKKIVSGVENRFTIISRAMYLVIIFFWIVAITLPMVGRMPSTMLSLLVTVLTVVIGIAAKPMVENLISGIVISLSNQLRVGDTLTIDDQYGTVEDISITHTKIKTWDWKRYIIPNSRMLTKEFTNLTLTEQQLWATLEFWVCHETDLETVREIAMDVARTAMAEPFEEEPFFWIRRMEMHGIVCCVCALAATPQEAWILKSEMATKLNNALRSAGIKTHLSRLDISGMEEQPQHQV